MENAEKKTGYPSIDKPWLKYYSEGAIHATLPECNIYEYLWKNNKNNLNCAALNYFGNKITYKEMFNNIEKVAVALASLGVKSGDIVTIFSINTPETIYCIYALNILGAVANLEYVTESEKVALLAIERTHSRVVIILDALFKRFSAITESVNVEKIVLLQVSSSMPPVKKALYNLKMKSTPSDKCVYLASIMTSRTQYVKASYKKDTPAIIVHSGGTTGIPKGVVLSNDNLNYLAWIFMNNENDTRCGDTWMCSIPVFHAFGLAMGVVFPLCQGMQLILVTKYTDEELINLFVKHKPNHIMASGAHIPSIQANKNIQQMDLSFFKTCGYGGTPLTVAKEKELVAFLKEKSSIARASVGYGMSETCSAVATELNRYYGKPGSSGIILCKANVKVLDLDTSEELQYGKAGELCFCTPGLMIGYYDNSKETNSAIFTDRDDNRWLRSGDVGYVDEDGFLFITGRIKRIYSTRADVNGTLYKMFPDYVASVISEVPCVKDCAVVCIDDPDYKSIAIAYVVLKDNSEQSSSSDIQQHLHEVLADYAVPKHIHFIDSIPMTPVGKVDYRALEREAEKLASRQQEI